MPHKEDYHCWRCHHHHFPKTLHQIQIVQQNHLWPRTPIRSKVPERTRKNTQIQISPVICLSPSNWWRNRKGQPGNQNLPLDILQIKPLRMGRTNTHGRIRPQHLTPLYHRQIPILSHHGIWTTSTPWHNKYQPSRRRKVTWRTCQSKKWSFHCPRACQTNHEKSNPVKIYTLQQQSMAWSQKPQKKHCQPKICHKKRRTFQNHQGPIFPLLSIGNSQSMENTPSVSCLASHPL